MTPSRSVRPEDIRNRCESCCTVRVVTDAVESTTSSRFLAIDLSPSRLAAGVVDARGEVLVRDRVATPARHMWPTLTRLVSRVLAAAPDDIVPTACGVSCVGPVDHDRGSMEPIGLPSWRGFPLRDELSEITGMHVTVDTSGRALALAERWCGDLAGADNFVALLIGDYVDGGVVLGGRLLAGANGNLGQVGHVQVEPEGAECFCGARGCLDVYAGGRAIEAATNRPLTRAPEVIIERAGLMVGRACGESGRSARCRRHRRRWLRAHRVRPAVLRGGEGRDRPTIATPSPVGIDGSSGRRRQPEPPGRGGGARPTSPGRIRCSGR